MSDFRIWRRILSEAGRGERVLAALEHIALAEKFFGHPYHPGRRARLLVFAQVMDEE